MVTISPALAPAAHRQVAAYVDPLYSDVAEYSFEYASNKFGEQESRSGALVTGVYYVALPDGRLQTVTYTVDGHLGYAATMEYSGETVYPPPAGGCVVQVSVGVHTVYIIIIIIYSSQVIKYLSVSKQAALYHPTIQKLGLAQSPRAKEHLDIPRCDKVFKSCKTTR